MNTAAQLPTTPATALDEHRSPLRFVTAASPVSYTHLDVYKRQVWTVILADVDQGIAEKRASQFGKLFQRLLPAGYVRETFAGRSACLLYTSRCV